MLLASVFLAFAPAQPPVAPQPRDAHGWVVKHTFTHKAPVTAVTATASGYVTGDRDGVLIHWDAKTGKLREALLDGTDNRIKPIEAVRLTPDGKRLNLATGGGSGQIEMTGTDRTFYGPNGLWSFLAICGDGTWLARGRGEVYGGNPQTLFVVASEFRTNTVISGFPHSFPHPTDVLLASSAPGLVASADANHTVRGWKLNKPRGDEQAEWSVDLKNLRPSALAVSPDGALVAVAGATGTVEVLRAKNGASVATLKGHKGAVRTVAFAHDSGLIATGGDDATVRLWNPWSGEQEVQLTDHAGSVTAVWFASDDVLLSASADKTARVWVYKP
jgi:WD40 repeat protein